MSQPSLDTASLISNISVAEICNGCVTGSIILAHAASSSDAVAKNNAALFDRVVGPVVAHQHSIRFNLPVLRLAVRQMSTAALFARNHKRYAKGMLEDFHSIAQMTPEAKALRESSECPSFSSHAGQGQGSDAICEEKICKGKHELAAGDGDKRVDMAMHTLETAGGMRDAVNRALGISDRPRRPRSVEDVEPTMLAFSLEMRQNGAFRSSGRSRIVNLSGQLLAMSIDRMLELGNERKNKFVRDQHLQQQQPAKPAKPETAKLAISMAANVRSRSRSSDPSPAVAVAAESARNRNRDRTAVRHRCRPRTTKSTITTAATATRVRAPDPIQTRERHRDHRDGTVASDNRAFWLQ